MARKEVTRESLVRKFEERLQRKETIQPKTASVRFYESMSAEEFSDARKQLDVSQSRLGQILDISTRAVQSYEQGINSVPGVVAKIMRLMCTNPNVLNAMILNTPDAPTRIKNKQYCVFTRGVDSSSLEQRVQLVEEKVTDHDLDIMLLNGTIRSFALSPERSEK